MATPESPAPKPPSKGRRFLKRLGVAAAVILLTALICGALVWNRPLGQPLAQVADQTTPIAQPTSAEGTPRAAQNPPAPTAEPQCGGPAVMKIVVIGSDSRLDNDYTSNTAFADSVRVVRVDF